MDENMEQQKLIESSLDHVVRHSASNRLPSSRVRIQVRSRFIVHLVLRVLFNTVTI